MGATTTNMNLRLISFTLLIGAASAAIQLATWDGASGTSFNFAELNDPVVGGQSNGTFSVDSSGKYGIFDGVVKDVPSLKAPGFIKAAAAGVFADISSAFGGDLVLTVRSSTPEYKGFRVAFVYGTLSPSYACSGGDSIPLSRGCYKAKFSVSAAEDFSTVRIPFTEFSDMWSPATGEHTKECKEDSSVCPTASGMKDIKRIEVWAEGALGDVHLEIQSIAAVEKSSGVTTFYDSVCGVPLFRAPVNRTLAEFEADTTEHGWPSFRPAEVVTEHVVTDKTTGLVTSSCGTHLGSFLPDSAGARWCMDLSCVSGNQA